MWTCESCGEELDEDQTECWICTKSRIDAVEIEGKQIDELSLPLDAVDLISSDEFHFGPTAQPDAEPSDDVETPFSSEDEAYQPLRIRFSLIHLLSVMTVMTVLLGVARWEVRMLPFLQVALVLAGVAVFFRTGAVASALIGAAVFYVWLGAAIFFGLMSHVKAVEAALFAFVIASPATIGVGAVAGCYFGIFNDRRRRRERRARRAESPSGALHGDGG
jgi:hypothetical protein